MHHDPIATAEQEIRRLARYAESPAHIREMYYLRWLIDMMIGATIERIPYSLHQIEKYVPFTRQTLSAHVTRYYAQTENAYTEDNHPTPNTATVHYHEQ